MNRNNRIETHRRESWQDFRRRRRVIEKRFREKIGMAGDFTWPGNYYEKVQFRKLWGNHGFYAMVADKLGVRDYVAQRIGQQYLVPLLSVHEQLTPADFDSFPDRFVINASHGCGWVKLVWDKAAIDIQATCDYFNDITGKVFGRDRGEYHYSLIDPRLLVLELLNDSGQAPCNYDIFCYNSARGFDYAITVERPGDLPSLHFDRDWNLLEGTFEQDEIEKYARPDNFGEMLEIARALSRDFDFARIDLYNLKGRIYFGEITLTPAAGFGRIENARREKMRSDMWKLDVNNRLLYALPLSRRLQFWRK